MKRSNTIRLGLTTIPSPTMSFQVQMSLAPGVVKTAIRKNSMFFLRKVLIDPYDEKGKPVYIEAWEHLGINKEKLNRLLMEQ